MVRALVKASSVSLAVHRFGRGRPTIVIHGGGPGCASRTDFGAARTLLEVGREIILIDLPQYGESAAVRISGGALDYHADVLAALLDELDLASVDIVGQSLGGAVAMRLAIEQPRRVRRLVATGSVLTPLPDQNDERVGLGVRVREWYYGGDGPSPEKMRKLIGSLEWYDAAKVPDSLVVQRYENSVTAAGLAFGLGHDGRGQAQDLTPILGMMTAPALLVWGEHDPFSDPDYARSVAAQLPEAQVAVIRETSHHPQSERPRAYCDVVMAFLDNPDLEAHS